MVRNKPQIKNEITKLVEALKKNIKVEFVCKR